MNKRKKQQNPGDSLYPSKPSKNSRLGDSQGSPQSSILVQSHHSREIEDSSEPASSAEPGGEEPQPTASSCPVEDTGTASDLPGSPEELVLLPPSQNSARKFVPQFSKPKKTVTRKAKGDEDPESCSISQETRPELSALQASSPPQKESLRFPLHEARRPSSPWADDTCSKEKTISPDIGSLGNSDFEMERTMVPDSSGQGRHLSDGDAEGREADSRAPQEGGSQEGGTRSQQSGQSQEGEGILSSSASTPASDPTIPWLKTGSVAQDLPVPTYTLSAGAAPSCSSPADAITDASLDPPVLQQRAPEVGKLPGSLDGQTPGGGYSETLLGDTPLAKKTTAGREEARLEEGSPGDITEASVPGEQEFVMDTGDLGHIAQEMSPGVKTEDPGSDGQLQGGMGMLPLQAQPTDQKAMELSSLNCHQDFEGLSLSPPTSQLEQSCAASDLPQRTKACHSSPGIPIDLAGQQQQLAPDSSDQAAWQESSAMELDFLPDSQIQNALDAPDVEALPEQGFPAGPAPGLGWPVPSACPIGGSLKAVAKAQPRPATGTWAQESCMQDATDTVRGLVVELSSLNRLIMSTHRDLEAFKRRKAKPLPYLTKGLGSLSRGEQGWRDL